MTCPKKLFQKQAEENKIRRERWQEKKSPEKRRRGSCLGECTILSINRIRNKQPCSPGKHGKPERNTPNTLTENVSEAYRCTQAINTRQTIPLWAAVSWVELKLIRQKAFIKLRLSERAELQQQSGDHVFFKSNALYKGFSQQDILFVKEYSLIGLKYVLSDIYSPCRANTCIHRLVLGRYCRASEQQLSCLTEVSCGAADHAWVCLIWWPDQPWC